MSLRYRQKDEQFCKYYTYLKAPNLSNGNVPFHMEEDIGNKIKTEKLPAKMITKQISKYAKCVFWSNVTIYTEIEKLYVIL